MSYRFFFTFKLFNSNINYINIHKMKNFNQTRTNDFKYDPLFTVSGPKDFHKAAVIARLRDAKYAIQPVFINMFSELQPRYRFVMRKTQPIPPYIATQQRETLVRKITEPHENAVLGANRLKYFHSPVITAVDVPLLKIPETPHEIDVEPETKIKNIKIQTKYRESSVQTSPWEPSFVVTATTDPEVLKLDFLKWGSGLPCGAHEITLIQRARMKREWEKQLPPSDNPKNLAKRLALISAMERDEWAFREQEIQDIQDLRLHLLELMLNELHEKSKCRSEARIKLFCDMKQAEKQEKLMKLKKSSSRELRRLENKHKGIISKYHPVNIVEEHVDRKSEVYAPLMRHGTHPKRWHQVIDEHLKRYRAQFKGVESFSTLPRWIDEATKINTDSLKLPGTRLCIRETKWTTPILKLLHESLKNLRNSTKKKCSLRIKVDKKKKGIITPEVDSISDPEEEMHQASVLIQSILRGRAAQKLIYNGRARCRELIQELKRTNALLEAERQKIFEEKLEVQCQQREQQLCLRNVNRIQEGLKRIQGSVLGTLLDFLSKELRRLLDERKAHALCLLQERERQKREAAEAGRRQIELRRRKEHDEMFKQVVKVHQDTVDLYLQDILTEGMNFVSETEAKNFIVMLSKQIDDTSPNTEECQPMDEQEEIIADLVHNFVLPEVEKRLVRDRIKKKQAKYLKTVHEAIYNDMEQLPKPQPYVESRRHEDTEIMPEETKKEDSPIISLKDWPSAPIILFSHLEKESIGSKEEEKKKDKRPKRRQRRKEEEEVNTEQVVEEIVEQELEEEEGESISNIETEIQKTNLDS